MNGEIFFEIKVSFEDGRDEVDHDIENFHCAHQHHYIQIDDKSAIYI